MGRRATRVVIVTLIVAIASGAFIVYGRGIWYPLLLQIRGPRTVADVLVKYGRDARVGGDIFIRGKNVGGERGTKNTERGTGKFDRRSSFRVLRSAFGVDV